MRYPFAEFERLIFVAADPQLSGNGEQAVASRIVADFLGTSLDQVYRWRKYGLDVEQADRFAVAAGFHPCEIWPCWFDENLVGHSLSPHTSLDNVA